MRRILTLAAIALLAGAAHGQKATDVFAVADGRRITAADMPQQLRDEYLGLPAALGRLRTELLAEMVSDILMDLEAKARNTTLRELEQEEIFRKAGEPTAEMVQNLYEVNRQAFGPRSFDEVRPQLTVYLRERSREEARRRFIETLKPKFKFSAGKDPSDAGSSDMVATVGGRPVTKAELEARYAGRIFEAEAEVYDALEQTVTYTVFEALIGIEAKSRGIDASDLIAREITDRLREYTFEERAALETALKRSLFSKYKAELLLKAPRAPQSSIPLDDDPVKGPAEALVTVVMFSDFQCPACAAAHPVLKQVVAEFGAKVRLAVKDFPLETIHPEALSAALAANAAAKQGKYFEYVEFLYGNQTSLSRDRYKEFAAAVGLNMQRFDVDFSDRAAADEVRKDYAEGVAAGVGGTPSIFVNGVRIRKGASAENLRSAISAALADRAAAKD